MSLTITIGGVDVTGKLGRNSFALTNAIGQRDVLALTTAAKDSYVPAMGAPVVVEHSELGAQFGGKIDRTEARRLGDAVVCPIQCASWEQIFDRRLVGEQKTFTDQPAGDVFQYIFDNWLTFENLTASVVATGPNISVSFDWCSVREAFDLICSQASDDSDVYMWDCTPGKVTRLYKQSSFPAPINVTEDRSDIFRDIIVTRTFDQYVNRVFVRLGNYVTEERSNTYSPDGTQDTLSFELPIAKAPTVTVDGTPKTVGIRDVDTGKDCYWQDGSADVVFSVAPALGTTVVITAQGYQSTVIDAGQNDDEVAERSVVEDNSGWYTKLIESSTIGTSADAIAFGRAYLAKFSRLPYAVEYGTTYGGIRAGMYQDITLTKYGPSFSGTFIVESSTLVQENGNWFWRIRAINGALANNWLTRLRQIATGKSGTIGGGGTAITPGASPLALTAALPNGMVGVAYSGPLIATGGAAPYVFSIASGALPTWATLDVDTGVITGTPTAADTTTFTARVTDASSTTQDYECSLVVISASSGAAIAPDNVTIVSVEADAQPTSGSSVRGSRNANTPKRGVLVTYTPPSPVGTFRGLYVQIEAPDQEIAYTTRGGRPGRLLDGSHALSEIDLSGPRAPLTFGPFAHADADGSIRVQIPEPDSAQLPMNGRVRLISFSDTVVNDAATAPSATFVIADPAASKPNSGTAYAPNPLSILIPATVPGTGIRATGATNPYTVQGGVNETHLWVYLDLDPRAHGYQLLLINPDGDTLNASGIETGSHFEMVFTTPTTVGTYTVYACGSDGTNINPLVPGITPSATVTLGTAGGTVDLKQSTADSRGRGLGVGADGLGIVDGGVTTDCIDAFAVSAAKIAAGAVETDKIADLSIITAKLAAGAVNSTKLADLAVEAAKLADSSVTATKIANAAVGTAAIANLAVGTAHIQDSAISNAKIGNLAVSTGKIQDAAITTAKINNLAVTTALIADAAVTNAKINDLAANKITAGTISASISMTAPTISVTSGTVTVNIDAANHVKVTDTAFSSYAQMSQGSVMVQSTVDSSYAALQYVSGSGILRLKNSSNTTTVDIYAVTTSTANAGVATLPSNPAGFISAKVNGVTVKIPYYAN